MAAFEPRVLGRTGLEVGPLGISGGYGAPAEAFEEAFERGCNYFYHGSRRKEGMARAIRNLAAAGNRERMVILLQSYSRSAGLMERFFLQGLKALDLERADILLLGWHNRPPSARILDRALRMKERGLFRFLAVSGHNRSLFPTLAGQGPYDLFHVRYNAAHRGAEEETLARLPERDRPGIVTYTATRWGGLLNPKKMPPGERPLTGAECYRFALTHPQVDVCMTGPGNLDQMREGLRALEAGPLSQEELARARRIGDWVHAHGRKFF